METSMEDLEVCSEIADVVRKCGIGVNENGEQLADTCAMRVALRKHLLST